MNLDEMIIAAFCEIDDALTLLLRRLSEGHKPKARLRSRGPQPKLCDSEVLTMEVIGSDLGLECDQASLVSSPAPTHTFSRTDTSASHHVHPSRRQLIALQRTDVATVAQRYAASARVRPAGLLAFADVPLYSRHLLP